MGSSKLRSRKFAFAVGTSVAIVALAILAAWGLPALAPVLDTVVGGLIGVLAVYCGGNVAHRWASSKADPGEAPPPAE